MSTPAQRLRLFAEHHVYSVGANRDPYTAMYDVHGVSRLSPIYDRSFDILTVLDELRYLREEVATYHERERMDRLWDKVARALTTSVPFDPLSHEQTR